MFDRVKLFPKEKCLAISAAVYADAPLAFDPLFWLPDSLFGAEHEVAGVEDGCVVISCRDEICRLEWHVPFFFLDSGVF